MSESTPSVDLDLDALLPPPKTFRLYGELYALPGETPLDTLIHTIQLREKFHQGVADANLDPLPPDAPDEEKKEREALEREAEHAMVESLEGMKQIVHGLLDSGGSMNGREYPRLGQDSIMHIISLAIGGKVVEEEGEPPSMPEPEDVVREGLTGGIEGDPTPEEIAAPI